MASHRPLPYESAIIIIKDLEDAKIIMRIPGRDLQLPLGGDNSRRWYTFNSRAFHPRNELRVTSSGGKEAGLCDA